MSSRLRRSSGGDPSLILEKVEGLIEMLPCVVSNPVDHNPVALEDRVWPSRAPLEFGYSPPDTDNGSLDGASNDFAE